MQRQTGTRVHSETVPSLGRNNPEPSDGLLDLFEMVAAQERMWAVEDRIELRIKLDEAKRHRS